jgi:hypothetical protein
MVAPILFGGDQRFRPPGTVGEHRRVGGVLVDDRLVAVDHGQISRADDVVGCAVVGG